MVIQSGILANSLRAQSRIRKIFKSGNAFFTSMSSSYVDEDYSDFLSWLERKAGAKISSTLSIGKSLHGRGIYASENIKKGDCLLKIPFSVQLAQDNLPPEINSLLGNNLDRVTKVALVILQEKKLGQDSEWAPYISRLPLPDDMHSSVFWSDEELEMIRPSCLYDETLRYKKLIERDFLAVKSVVDRFPSRFQDPTLEEFTYAYQLVKSRAWKCERGGVSMIPFADFINHCNTSESDFFSDERRQCSVIVADRDFAAGEEVVMRYGKYGNATLLLGFGFTIPHNTYDFDLVNLSGIAQDHNQLCSSDQMLGLSPSWNAVKIHEVRSMEDIPLSLRAFARILACGSQLDIRVGRDPLENKETEIAAHRFLYDEISKLIENHDEHISKLVVLDSCEKSVIRRQLAVDLLQGELRVLKSACAWLEDYCLMLRTN
ncbi:hypothetical protein ACS0TY_012061 [Phlomoides rotata]